MACRKLTLIVLSFVVFATIWTRSAPGAKHENWIEVRSPNFIVVSNAGEKQARKTAIHFEQIRGVFRRWLPVASAHTSPVVTILALKDDSSVKALLPEYWEKNHVHPAGMFLENFDQYFAIVDLDANVSDPFETIYHEYYHSLTSPYYPNLPVWLSEGLAEFFGHTTINDSDVEMGTVDGNLLEEIKQGNLIPLNVLLTLDRASPYYNEQNKTSMFYAESWALTHYLMVDSKTEHRPMLTAYLNALADGDTQDQAATKAFGDVKKLQAALVRYIGQQSFNYIKTPPAAAIPDGDLHVRQLSDAEVDAYRGGFEAVRARTDQAMPLLQEAIKLDPNLALAYQYLGLAQYLDAKHAEALASFKRAIELNPNNALTRYWRADLASTQEGAVADDGQMVDDLRTAIALNPEFAPPYGALAIYLSNQQQDSAEALKMAQKAVQLEPGVSAYQFDLAEVLLRLERLSEARAAARTAEAESLDPRERKQAEDFLAALKRAESSGESDRPTESSEEADSSADETRTGETKNASDATGLREATGVVTKVSCMDGVKLEMQADGQSLMLHIPPNSQVKIQMMTAPPPGGFNPCKDLQGHEVDVRYSPDDKKERSGTLEGITLLADDPAKKSGR